MRFLPIVARELRGASRQRGTYWARTAVAAGAVLISVLIFLANLGTAAKSGGVIFKGLSGLLFLFCLVSGRRFTVDCLSVEKREGTLGLLFLTDLKGYDVVLGKLAATSLNGLYGLLAAMPVLAFSMLLGGIASGEFWRMVLVLADTFLFSLAVGIFSSAVSRDARRATAANFALLLFFIGVLPSGAAWVAYLTPGHPFVPQFCYTCPGYLFYLCFDINYVAAGAHFWWTAGIIHGLTWLLVILASCIIPRTWQDKPLRTEKAPVRGLWQAWNFGPAAGRGAFRQRLLDINAFYWLAGRARFKPLHVWVFLGAMACWWLWGWFNAGHLWYDVTTPVVLGLLLNTTFKFWFTIESAQQLAEDQRMGTLELMLPTPLSVRDILRGQTLALQRQFFWPLAAAIVAELWLMWVAMKPGNHGDREFLFTLLAATVMLPADLLTLQWVAMRRALTAKNASRASLAAISWVLLLPWAAFFGVRLAISVYQILWDDGWSPGWKFDLGLWLGLGIATDLFFGLRARRQLLTSFHELAMHRFSPKPATAARWFGRRGDTGTLSTQLKTSRALHVRWWKRKTVIAVFLLLLAFGVWSKTRRIEHQYPPPVTVAITQSNTPLFVSPGTTTFIVLPDGFLWRWGLNQAGRPTEVEVPEPVGTNHDWTKISGDYWKGLGLRKDGTLWNWATGRTPPSGPTIVQTGTDQDWQDMANGGSHSLAIKQDGSLWAWGNNAQNQLGNGPGSNQNSAVQVGTNHDWLAANCVGLGSMALRKDGTLWAWGSIQSASPSGGFGSISLPLPIQICQETNWVRLDFSPRFGFAAWNDAGELWELSLGPGTSSTNTGIAANGRQILSGFQPNRFALAIVGGPKLYQIRPDGTLWESDFAAGINVPTTPNLTAMGGPWRRTGTRSDWVSIWGRAGTIVGLTADGTVWTWGRDWSRKPEVPFSARLQVLQDRIMGMFKGVLRTAGTASTPPYVKKPRPLMRLMYGNTAKPGLPGNEKQ